MTAGLIPSGYSFGLRLATQAFLHDDVLAGFEQKQHVTNIAFVRAEPEVAVFLATDYQDFREVTLQSKVKALLNASLAILWRVGVWYFYAGEV
jgi:hypothetical protein